MYAEALASQNVQAFLRVIRAGEGTADEDGYRRHFGGELFDSFADHPRRAITKRLGGRPITSTAAGAFQFLARTWDECARSLKLPDFSPANQDLAAVFLIHRRKALDDVLAGRIEAAIAKCAREWASLPGSPYGQPTKTMEQALAVWSAHGGSSDAAPQPPPTVETQSMPLAPFIAAALPSIVQAIPMLGKLFGSGSDIAARNVKAAEIAVQLVSDAVGAKNAQEAVDVLRDDPAAVKAATKAVEEHWFQLVEVGGGVEAARKHDRAIMESDGPWWQALRSPSFWALLLLLPLVYLIVLSIIGVVGPVVWSDDVRASIAGLIVGSIVGGAVGYYWGQTTSRNRGQAAT